MGCGYVDKSVKGMSVGRKKGGGGEDFSPTYPPENGVFPIYPQGYPHSYPPKKSPKRPKFVGLSLPSYRKGGLLCS
jgi:hypothetical protein